MLASVPHEIDDLLATRFGDGRGGVFRCLFVLLAQAWSTVLDSMKTTEMNTRIDSS
jgi:hypothetical protein